MSKWQKAGTVPAVTRALPVEVVPPHDERSTSSWESAVAYTPPRITPGEHDVRVRRLAKQRDTCPVCKALTGERCWDLAQLPAKAHLRMFHRGRQKLPPVQPVERMTRLPSRKTECRCGHIRGYHKNRENSCLVTGPKAKRCTCRKFVQALALVKGATRGNHKKKRRA